MAVDNFISGVDAYVLLGAAPYSFRKWTIPYDGGCRTFFAFGSNFRRTLPGGLSADITLEGAYNQGNMPLVLQQVYPVHLGWEAGIELLTNARVNKITYSNETGQGGEPGGQAVVELLSDGEFEVAFT
jgi:hypothetical protein